MTNALEPDLHMTCVRKLGKLAVDFPNDFDSIILGVEGSQKLANNCCTHREGPWAGVCNVYGDADQDARVLDSLDSR